MTVTVCYPFGWTAGLCPLLSTILLKFAVEQVVPVAGQARVLPQHLALVPRPHRLIADSMAAPEAEVRHD
jgi:hypothetical protein